MCHKCQTDVNPVKVLRNSTSTRRDQGDGGGVSGVDNVCPTCSMVLPDDDSGSATVASSEDDAANEPIIPIRQSVRPKPVVKAAAPRKTGSIVDDLRAELDAEDAQVASWSAEIERLKREIKLAKQRNKGRANMLAAYERANPSRAEVQ